jgi:hypothetical protein
MTFIEMRDLLIKHFEEMTKEAEHLFEANLNKDELWQTYLNSYPAGSNPMFRERTEHDCSCCRGFIKNIGNVMTIKDGKVETIWDFECDDAVYGVVIKAMSQYVKQFPVSDVYLSSFSKIGCHHNFEEMENVGVHRWDHFYLELPKKYTVDSFSKGTKLSEFHSAKDVLLRALNEISMDAVDTVLELIATNTLYKGPEYERMMKQFKALKKDFDKLSTDTEKNLFAWEQSVKVGGVVSRIRNHAIGTLLVDITCGRDLDDAVRAYEVITAPANYKRSKPVYTQKMLDDARKTIDSLGYTDSLPRRYANLDDITINDILFVDRSSADRVQGASSIFDELSKTAKTTAKKFDRAEEITAETFVNDVLPTAESVEVCVENKHIPNFVSLIAPVTANAKSMFKWGNNYSWAYSGNMTDSMKERVKLAGGKVDGDLRFSIQWNEDGHDNCDLDAHCKEADGFEIYFGSAKKPSRSRTLGQLDVDIINPNGNIAVENITWDNRRTMKPGEYTFFVHVYSGSARNGFRAEIEFDGQIYSFDYSHSMRYGERVVVAKVVLDRDGNFTIKPALPDSMSNKTVWNISTNNFVPVSVICYSPNYWETVENPNGHKHLFFMLKDCKNDENPSGLFNEFLVQELYDHRKVMEALSGKLRVADSDDQLSGLGFAFDKRAEIVVRVKGATERVLKVKF